MILCDISMTPINFDKINRTINHSKNICECIIYFVKCK